MSGQIGHNSCEDTSLVWDGLAMEFRIDHNLVDGPATDHLGSSSDNLRNRQSVVILRALDTNFVLM